MRVGIKLTVTVYGTKPTTASSATRASLRRMGISRKKGKLHDVPETIAQALLAVFAKGVLGDDRGLVLREFASGIGYVDLGIVFSSTLHLVEIKILRDGELTGVEQLDTYMRTEGRKQGWLLVVDARRVPKGDLPDSIRVGNRLVHVVGVEINPIPPSKR